MSEKVVIGNAELWHGDCREVLPMLPVHDLLCTDPPYGIGASAGTGKYGRLKIEAATDLGWDNETPPQWLLLLLLEKAEHKVIFGGNYFALPPSRAYLVWDKGAGFKATTGVEGILPGRYNCVVFKGVLHTWEEVVTNLTQVAIELRLLAVEAAEEKEATPTPCPK
jgi:hypothetical protein